jgi:hypothetical protein
LAFNNTNYTFSNIDNSGNIIDQKKPAIATSNVVDNGSIRIINRIDVFANLAVRNGNEANVVLTMLPSPLIYTNTLTLNKTYRVFNAAITTNGSSGSKTYSVGDYFIAKNDTTHSLAFFSGTDTFGGSISAGTTLTDLGLYEVEAGASVIYKGTTYATGERFQVYIDLTGDPTSNVFSGSGTVKQFNGGFVRQVYETYGITGITAGTAIRANITYEVVGGTSVTYGGTVYTTGKRFTCLATIGTSFTSAGGATLSEFYIGWYPSTKIRADKTSNVLTGKAWLAFPTTEAPLVNVDGSGNFTFGQLDSGFNRATSQPFATKYWQSETTIQGLNIQP